MPSFRYTGVTREGARTKGVVEAESQGAARGKLRSEGTWPLSVDEVTRRGRLLPGISLLGGKEHLPLFTRQLATLVGAGVPLVSGLSSLAAQVDDPALRRVVESVREELRAGQPLARALEAHPEVFPEIYANMVRAGEESGSLPLSLSRLADHLESQERTRTRVRSALTYPLLMAVVAALVVVFLLTFVVPKIVGVFGNLGQAVPLPTRILLAITGVLGKGWWAILLFLAAAVLAFRRLASRPAGRRAIDALSLRIPVAGRILQLSALSRFARTLSTLAAGGIPIDRALRVTAPVVGNAAIASRVEEAAARVVEGASLTNALRPHPEFPPSLVQMVAVGEESGRLDFLLGKASDAIDGEVEARLARALALLEPAIILLMGAVVAFIVVAILLPLLQISTLVR